MSQNLDVVNNCNFCLKYNFCMNAQENIRRLCTKSVVGLAFHLDMWSHKEEHQNHSAGFYIVSPHEFPINQV